LRAMRPGELRELAATIRELSRSYEEFGNVLSGVVDTLRPLKRIIGDPNVEAKAEGSRMIAAGIALIAFPDPTITDLIGVGLVAAGLLENKMRQITVVDTYREFQEVIGRVGDISRELRF